MIEKKNIFLLKNLTKWGHFGNMLHIKFRTPIKLNLFLIGNVIWYYGQKYSAIINIILSMLG